MAVSAYVDLTLIKMLCSTAWASFVRISLKRDVVFNSCQLYFFDQTLHSTVVSRDEDQSGCVVALCSFLVA